jgi:hypothetical protein
MAPRLTNGHSQNKRPNGRAGSHIPLTLSVLGVLGVAFGVHSYWRGDAEKPAEKPADTTTAVEHLNGLPRTLRTPQGVEPAPINSGRPAFEQASAERPQQTAALVGSSAPSVESAGEDSVLQALGESDDETRFQRLQEAIGSGAEIPVDRMHDILETDPSDKVRELALTALTEHQDAGPPEIRAVAEGALGNTSIAVRTQAGRILERMDELERIDRESRGMQREM